MLPVDVDSKYKDFIYLQGGQIGKSLRKKKSSPFVLCISGFELIVYPICMFSFWDIQTVRCFTS